ncbi:MAG: efflux RND transporter permease subunit, partial [Phycisphaerales bacterium]
QEAMEALPGVGKVLSMVTVLRAVPVDLLTGSTARSAAAVDFARQQLDRYAGPGQMRYVMLLHETGMHRTYEIGQQAERVASEILGDDVNVEASGFMYLAGMWIEENVRSQRYAIMISFAVIAVVMMLLFRSVTVGLGSMLPNAVPLLLLGGALGLLWRVVDSDMAVLVLIAIGIAVDDTIHFLARYRVERPRSESVKQAIERTFSTAGRAIVMTSLIFAAGFAPLAFSDYLTIRLMGLLLPLIMIAALVADLLLLPALITVGAIRLSR